MRPYILAVLLIVASLVKADAQTMPTFPHVTYPETGTFCGVLMLCPKVEKAENPG